MFAGVRSSGLAVVFLGVVLLWIRRVAQSG
jgi:hypothetical protein